MSNHWSEDGDILVHDYRSRVGWLVVFVLIVTIPLFFISLWVGVVGSLMLWSLMGFQALADVDRVEFDRRSKTMRQRSALGLKWTDPLDRFACVEVVRRRGPRGWVQIRVSLRRAGEVRLSESPDYVVALYGSSGEAARQEAREWGDRLARFLQLPLKVDL
jgi:hypothetical protein